MALSALRYAEIPPVGQWETMTTNEGFLRFVLNEPWPHYVFYCEGKTVYVSPEFFCTLRQIGPNDSVWIVPGTQ